MEDYNVEIRFPRQSDPDPNLVAVSGTSEDAVYDCIDHLRNLEEEYLQVKLLVLLNKDSCVSKLIFLGCQ